MQHATDTSPTPAELALAAQKLAAENARYKDELEQARAALHQYRAMLGQIGQQLRIPLSAIIGYGEILHRSSQDEGDRQKLAHLLHAADSLASLLHDLPTAQPMEANLNPRPCKTAVLAPQLEGFFAYEAHDKGLSFAVHWDSAIPDGLYCDLPRLRQVLLILVHNAVKFTTQGSVTVDIRLTGFADHEAEIAFIIEDTGIGIKQERLPHLFSNTPVRGAFGRAGHSLPLAAQWIRAMGGELQVESHLGEGSRFSFTLAFPIQSPRKTPAIGVMPNAPLPDWRQSCVLVVDDDAVSRGLLVAMSHNLGVGKADAAADGKEAAEKALAADYDLVLMDCQMPGMDGFAATRLLRGQPHTAALPIIGITAEVTRTDTAKCYAAGMVDYYHKPVTLSTLERIFHKWLPVRQASAT